MRSSVLFLIAGAVAISACEDVGSPDNALAGTEAGALADEMGDFFFGSLESQVDAGFSAAPAVEGLALTVIEVNQHTEITRTCPEGGQVVIVMDKTGTFDRETRSGTIDMEGTKTQQQCAFQARGHIITTNGDPNLAMASHHQWENGAPVGLQTMDLVGQFTWSTDDGREGVCPVDLHWSFDPETQTRSLTGTFCDSTIDRTGTRTRGPGSQGTGSR